MREAVFRSLAGLIAALAVLAVVLMARQGFNPDIIPIALFGVFFGLYAALGEYRIRWFLGLIGAKDTTSQKSGGGKLGE